MCDNRDINPDRLMAAFLRPLNERAKGNTTMDNFNRAKQYVGQRILEGELAPGTDEIIATGVGRIRANVQERVTDEDVPDLLVERATEMVASACRLTVRREEARLRQLGEDHVRNRMLAARAQATDVLATCHTLAGQLEGGEQLARMLHDAMVVFEGADDRLPAIREGRQHGLELSDAVRKAVTTGKAVTRRDAMTPADNGLPAAGENADRGMVTVAQHQAEQGATPLPQLPSTVLAKALRMSALPAVRLDREDRTKLPEEYQHVVAVGPRGEDNGMPTYVDVRRMVKGRGRHAAPIPTVCRYVREAQMTVRPMVHSITISQDLRDADPDAIREAFDRECLKANADARREHAAQQVRDTEDARTGGRPVVDPLRNGAIDVRRLDATHLVALCVVVRGLADRVYVGERYSRDDLRRMLLDQNSGTALFEKAADYLRDRGWGHNSDGSLWLRDGDRLMIHQALLETISAPIGHASRDRWVTERAAFNELMARVH